ncbi:MAG: MMPL family transporter [Oscillospiraceae bacterium]|nr:MMPL family transporter [Oscillospiraceae bacterium]
MRATRINYDMLSYLPDDLDTVQGQDILLEEFGKGAFSFIVVEDMPDKDVAALRAKLEQVPHVESAIWYDSVADLSIPKEFLPDDLRDVFVNGDATMIALFFDSSSSADETIEAIETIRSIADKQCYVSGISALVTDLKNLCEREEPIYVAVAVLCAVAAMELLTDSWLVPPVFLAGIGITILYNLGTNWFFGEISYITKALAAVLQLAVTMDYSIFLWHAYCARKREKGDRQEAMAAAIGDTVLSVSGSSLTTIAGFLALCFMTYTMGMDIGLVMAKGCLLGVLGSVTILPALILTFDGALTRTMHRALIPDLHRAANWITRHSWVFLILFVIVLIPAAIGYSRTPVYYDFTKILSGDDMESLNEEDMQFHIANEKLAEYFDVSTTHIVLCDADLPAKDAAAMLKEFEQVDGVTAALGINSVLGSALPEDFLPEGALDVLKGENHQLILINSAYKVSTDACNDQIDALQAILKRYDASGLLIGEGPCTKDLIEITDKDFAVVSWVSIGFVFLIILLTMRSISLPVILVAVIEFAVFINLGIPYYTGFTMPFIAPICISTIQLGSTVDYAILLTTRYKSLRLTNDKRTSVTEALAYAMPSVIVSALSFFAATFGVGIFSDVDLISSMCNLLARGAIVSMLAVLLVLPALLMLLDPLVVRTSLGMRSARSGRRTSGTEVHV